MDDAINSILSAHGVKLIDIQPNQAAVVPDGYKLQDLETLLQRPARIRSTVKLTTAADFVAYVTRFKRPDSTNFVAPNLDGVAASKPLVSCVLDYHGDKDLQPSWCDHHVWFLPTKTPAYELLCALDGKLMDQQEFAQRLRDLARFCASHPAAEIIEVVQSMTLTSSGDFTSLNDEASGSVRLAYTLDVSAKAGTQERRLDVPRKIDFRVPIFIGAEKSTVSAELLYRTPKGAGQQVQLGIRLPDRKWVELELVQQLADQIREQTGLMTLVGSR